MSKSPTGSDEDKELRNGSSESPSPALERDTTAVKRNIELLKARAEFVKMIKDENFYSDFSKQSLKQHWAGAASGFSCDMVQRRWQDFWAGWQREQRRD